MPVSTASPTLFPSLSRAQINAARTSAWHPTFRGSALKTTIIDLTDTGFGEWLESDSIFLPEDSEGIDIAEPKPESETEPQKSRSRASSDASLSQTFALPKVNAAIRSAIAKYDGAGFPKLNWSSPKDAAWILPQTSSGPLNCATPSDVYLLLKSSDFVAHDTDPLQVYEHVSGEETASEGELKLELVLKKWYDMNPSREFRCFVRDNVLIGITQRDTNYYDHLQKTETLSLIRTAVKELWEDEIKGLYAGGRDYIFDLYLTTDYRSGHIIDFQPYTPSIDSLLFTYEELFAHFVSSSTPSIDDGEVVEDVEDVSLPVLKVIDSRAHPSANRNAPTYASSMMPMEALALSEGRGLEEFGEAWTEALKEAVRE